jgi:hypothetical protein
MEFAKQKEAGVLPKLKVLRLVEVCQLGVSAETRTYEAPGIVKDVFWKAGVVLVTQFFTALASPHVAFLRGFGGL